MGIKYCLVYFDGSRASTNHPFRLNAYRQDYNIWMLEQTREFYSHLIRNKLREGYDLLLPQIKQPEFLNSTLEALVS